MFMDGWHVIHKEIVSLGRNRAELEFKSVLLDNATDAIIAHDLDGNMLYANESACASRGYTLDELRGMTLEQYVSRRGAKNHPPASRAKPTTIEAQDGRFPASRGRPSNPDHRAAAASGSSHALTPLPDPGTPQAWHRRCR